MPQRKVTTNKQPISFSLTSYVLTIFTIGLLIAVVSFKLFWDSPTRELAVSIQQATEDSLDNPFFLPIDSEDIDTSDGVLKTAELHQIQKQIQTLRDQLDIEADFNTNLDETTLNFLKF